MCGVTTCWLSMFSVCGGVVLYIVLGAIAFFFLETNYTVAPKIYPVVPTYNRSTKELDHLRNATVQKLWTLTMELNVFYESNWTHLAEMELQKFQEELIQQLVPQDHATPWGSEVTRSFHETDVWSSAVNIWGSHGVESFENFPAALLYSLTLITTIGYGSVSPRSLAARVLTVFYAAIGIPLTLCYLATVGDFLSRLIRAFYMRVMKKREGVPIPVSLVLVLLYLCGGAGVFCWLESWPFLDAVFFCFASLATIGFGGMMDPMLSKHVSLLISSVYILLGMALISTVFNLVQEEIVRKKENRRPHHHPPIS